MAESPFKRWKPGGMISASEHARLQGAVERHDKLFAAGGGKIRTQQTGGGTMLYVDEERTFWLKVTGAPTGSAYPWQEQTDNGDGTFSALAEGRTGTATSLPAYEANGNLSVPTDAVCRAWVSPDRESVAFLYTPSGGSTSGAGLGVNHVTLSSDQNNYVVTADTTVLVVATSGADRALTGIYVDGEKRLLWVVNEGTHALTLRHDSSSSSSGNRILCPKAIDLTLAPGEGVGLAYSTTDEVWYCLDGAYNPSVSIGTLGAGSWHDYAVDDETNVLGLAPTSTSTITGLDGGGRARVLWIVNTANTAGTPVLPLTLTLAHDSSSSLAANRIRLPHFIDLVLRPQEGVCLVYSTVDSCWYCLDDNYCSNPFIQHVSLSSDQNDYAIGQRTETLIVDATSSFAFTGFVAGRERRLFIVNKSATNTVTLKDEDSGSVVSNQMRLPGGADYVLGPQEGVGLVYTETNARWYCLDESASVDPPGGIIVVGSSQNNYDPGDDPIVPLDPSSSVNITGFVARPAGSNVTLVNTSSTYSITIPNQSSSSTSANRVRTPSGGDYVLGPGQSVTLTYGADGGSYWTMSGTTGYPANMLPLGLSDPGADRLLFWDDSASAMAHLSVGSGLSISGTTLSATGSSPTGTSGSAVLGSGYTVTNSWGSTGLSVSLPDAGTYLVQAEATAEIQVSGAANGEVRVRLYNSTTAAAVSGTQRCCVQAQVTGLLARGSAACGAIVTTSGAETVRLEAMYSATGSVTSSQVLHTTNGETSMRYVKLA